MRSGRNGRKQRPGMGRMVKAPSTQMRYPMPCFARSNPLVGNFAISTGSNRMPRSILPRSIFSRMSLGVLGILVVAVLRFPFHEAIFAKGDCPGFRGHHVAHYADGVIDEHGGDFLHIVPKLQVGFADIGFFTGRRF